jgi:hypothetical protein
MRVSPPVVLSNLAATEPCCPAFTTSPGFKMRRNNATSDSLLKGRAARTKPRGRMCWIKRRRNSGFQGHLLLLVAMRVVFPAEGDALSIKRE